MDTQQDDPNLDDSKKKDKKDKVRSAWISFAGRIIAQLVGAIATVSLGVMMLNRYSASDRQPPAAADTVPPYYSEPAAWAPEPRRRPVVIVVVLPAATPPDRPGYPARDADVAARQAEVARVIATAVSAAMPVSP